MPFHNDFDSKFKKIETVAIKLGFNKATRTKEGWMANDIVHEILDGIGNSRTLLFDLSNDPKTSFVNGNVLYELGIADAIREPEDIFIIKEKSGTQVPFDASHIRYNEYEGEFSEDWLEKKLGTIIENQKWYKSRRVETAAKSIDGRGFELILSLYPKKPVGEDHFNDQAIGNEPKNKLAILRLIDLGILWFATEKKGQNYGWAYHWTPFGREVIKYLNIEKK
ncbi:MAG: hypothetical protein AB1333_04450 [Patescibacteria group bacterium]